MEWLNKRAADPNSRCATWHIPSPTGSPGDYSDLFLWKDNGREGSDSDMPKTIWTQLCNLAGEDFAGILWITFLET